MRTCNGWYPEENDIMKDSIYTRDLTSFYVIGVSGKFNTALLPDIRKAVECALATGRKKIVFDMSKTTNLDSSGLGLLATLHKNLLASGGKIILVGLIPNVRKLLDTTGFLRQVEAFDKLPEPGTSIKSTFKISENGFYVLFKVPQQFNVDTIKAVRDAMTSALEKGYIQFVFDFTENRLITSVGIGILSNLHGKLKPKGGSVHLCGLTPEIRSLLEATNVLKVIPEYPGIADIDRKLI
jgi:anti-anti-sigma factor